MIELPRTVQPVRSANAVLQIPSENNIHPPSDALPTSPTSTHPPMLSPPPQECPLTTVPYHHLAPPALSPDDASWARSLPSGPQSISIEAPLQWDQTSNHVKQTSPWSVKYFSSSFFKLPQRASALPFCLKCRTSSMTGQWTENNCLNRLILYPHKEGLGRTVDRKWLTTRLM